MGGCGCGKLDRALTRQTPREKRGERGKSSSCRDGRGGNNELVKLLIAPKLREKGGKGRRIKCKLRKKGGKRRRIKCW